MILFQDSYFTAQFADSEALLHRTHQLRYQVYCVEAGFEPLEQDIAGEEHDELDGVSVQFLLTHRESNIDVGCVRLILPGRLEACPFYKVTNKNLDSSLLSRRGIVSEISRLAISKKFRQRAEDQSSLFGSWSTSAPPRVPYAHRGKISHSGIVMALYRCLYLYSKTHGINTWYTLMEPALSRLLRYSGFTLQSIGKPIVYRGRQRIPFMAHYQDLANEIARKNPALWSYLKQDLK